MIFGGYGGDRDSRRGGGIGALLMIILAPFAAMLIQLAVSRSREYGADDTGAHWTGNPYALASALAKIDANAKQQPLVASPSTAHLFYHPTVSRWDELWQPVLHASANREENRAPDRKAGGIYAINSALSVQPSEIDPVFYLMG
jgi:Zn-dependent protease with chaperone function